MTTSRIGQRSSRWERIEVRHLDSRSADAAAAIPNVIHVPLRALMSAGRNPLARAIAGVAQAAAEGGQHYAAHGSSPVTDSKNIDT